MLFRFARWMAVTLVALAVGMYAWQRAHPPQLQAVLSERKNVTLYASFDGTVRAPFSVVLTCPYPAARVKRVLVQEGEIVQPGQTIVELDDSLARASLARAEANVRAARRRVAAAAIAERSAERKAARQAQVARWSEAARRDYANRVSHHEYCLYRKHWALEELERARATGSRERIQAAETKVRWASIEITRSEHQVGVVYKSYAREPFHPEREAAEEALKAAEKALRLARKDIADPVLRSGVRGLVRWVDVRPGDRVTRHETLISLTDLGQMRVVIPTPFSPGDLRGRWWWMSRSLLYPDYAPYLDRRSYEDYVITAAPPGALVCVTTPEAPGVKARGRVGNSWDYDPFHPNYWDEENINLGWASEDLRPGMKVEARIVTGYCEDAITLPRSAVLGPFGNAAVLVVRDGRVERRTVYLRGWTRRTAVIADGLEEGETVVRYPLPDIHMGKPARPVLTSRSRKPYQPPFTLLAPPA